MFESLEIRRLLSFDLGFGEVSSTLPFHHAGETMDVTVQIQNFGDHTVPQGFFMEYKLVKVGYIPDIQLPDFFAPGAISLTTVAINKDIINQSSGQEFTTTLTLPSV